MKMKIDIITGKKIEDPKNAYKVKRDTVIKFLEQIKKKLNIYKGNELYVSKENLEVYKQKRKKFEKNFMLSMAIITLIIIIATVPALLKLDAVKFIYGLIFSLLIGILFFVFVFVQYVPEIEEKKKAKKKKVK